MSDRHWEHFHHEADIGVHGIAPTPAAAFAEAAVALTAVVADPASIAAREKVEIHCEAPDIELLLVDWLNAVIFEMTTRRMLFSRFSVHLAGHRLQGIAVGEPVDVGRHQPAVEVKGATMTALKVYRDQHGRWHAQCVVDV